MRAIELAETTPYIDMATATEEQQLAAIDKWVWAIEQIPNPSIKVQMAAINNTPSSVVYINNPDPKVVMAALKKRGGIIADFIKKGIKLTDEQKLAAITSRADAIKYVDKPTEAMQLAAVRQNGETIQYIIKQGIKPSEAVKMAAVNQNGSAIQWIKNPSPAVQLAAVKNHGWAITGIDNPTSEAKIQAEPFLIKDILTLISNGEYSSAAYRTRLAKSLGYKSEDLDVIESSLKQLRQSS